MWPAGAGRTNRKVKQRPRYQPLRQPVHVLPMLCTSLVHTILHNIAAHRLPSAVAGMRRVVKGNTHKVCGIRILEKTAIPGIQPASAVPLTLGTLPYTLCALASPLCAMLATPRINTQAGNSVTARYRQSFGGCGGGEGGGGYFGISCSFTDRAEVLGAEFLPTFVIALRYYGRHTISRNLG